MRTFFLLTRIFSIFLGICAFAFLMQISELWVFFWIFSEKRRKSGSFLWVVCQSTTKCTILVPAIYINNKVDPKDEHTQSKYKLLGRLFADFVHDTYMPTQHTILFCKFPKCKLKCGIFHLISLVTQKLLKETEEAEPSTVQNQQHCSQIHVVLGWVSWWMEGEDRT